MNLSGVPNYNRELTPLRNSSSIGAGGLINKLVFLFPMIFDDGLQRVKFNTVTQGDADNLVDLIRSFHCISVLKEILVSNALNIVTLAAKYNEDVVEDKSDESKTYRNLITGGNSNSSSTTTTYKYGRDVDQYALTTKLHEKIEYITRLIKTDPRYTKLLPFIEIITLNNMFDVPVVVGTSPSYVPSNALFSFLVGSIGLRKSICVGIGKENASLTNVQSIINALKVLSGQRHNDLYNDLQDDEKTPSTPDELLNQYYGGTRSGASLKIPFINNFLRKFEKKKPIEVYKNSASIANNSTSSQYAKNSASRLMKKSEGMAAFEYIKELTQDDFLQLRIAFENSLNSAKLSEKYGLRDESGASRAFKQVEGKYYDLFITSIDDFISVLMNKGSVYIDSVYAILKPADSLQIDPSSVNSAGEALPWSHKYSKDNIEEAIKVTISSKLTKLVNDKLNNELSTLMQAKDFSDSQINTFGRMCESAKEEVNSVLEKTAIILDKYEVSDTHTADNIRDFMDAIHKINQIVDGASEKFTRALTTLLGASSDTILKPIHKVINDAIEDILMLPLKQGLDDTIDQNGNYVNQYISNIYDKLKYKARLIDPYGKVYWDWMPINKTIANEVFTDCSKSLITYLNCIMSLILYVKTCEFINMYSVELKTSEADVLELPNFSLTIPLKYANFLYALKSQKDWKAAILGSSDNAFNPFRTTDPKFVVREINNILNIPNLYVYDESKKEVYYKLQWYKNVEKMKLAAMNIFVSEHLKKPEIFQPY